MPQAKVLNEKELRKVMLYCANHKHAARNKSMLLMTHLSGMRVGEVSSLKLGDVIGSDGCIKSEVYLTAQQTKGDRGRTVLFPLRLQELVEQYIKNRFKVTDISTIDSSNFDRALFPTQKSPKRGFTPNTLAQLFHYLYKRAGVDGASSHSGRRSFITNLSELGVSVFVLKELAGHKSIATTQRYVTVNPAMMRNAVELI
jgi:integrase/recombinase XerD